MSALCFKMLKKQFRREENKALQCVHLTFCWSLKCSRASEWGGATAGPPLSEGAASSLKRCGTGLLAACRPYCNEQQGRRNSSSSWSRCQTSRVHLVAVALRMTPIWFAFADFSLHVLRWGPRVGLCCCKLRMRLQWIPPSLNALFPFCVEKRGNARYYGKTDQRRVLDRLGTAFFSLKKTSPLQDLQP